MPTAYVLINYDIGTEEKFLDKLIKVPGIIEVSEVNGVYDIVVKIASRTLDSLKDTITRHIRTIDRIPLTYLSPSSLHSRTSGHIDKLRSDQEILVNVLIAADL